MPAVIPQQEQGARIASFSRAGRCISRDGICWVVALGKDSWEGDSGRFGHGCGANESER